MDGNIALLALATMGGLGLFFAVFLAFADKKLKVEENPKVQQIYEMIPNANCGACGCAGCYDFAVKVVEGKVPPEGCLVGGADLAVEIGKILGVEVGQATRYVARVLCKGGNLEARRKNVVYEGPQSCATMALVSGGDKLCLYGCLGGGDCVEACQFNAIYMNDNGLPEVIEDLCVGCGMCAKACPRNIIEMHPIERNVFVFCKNQDDPKKARTVCSVACIGCGICARKSEGAIAMENNLAFIKDYDLIDTSKIPFEKCPTKAIHFIGKIKEKETEKIDAA